MEEVAKPTVVTTPCHFLVLPLTEVSNILQTTDFTISGSRKYLDSSPIPTSIIDVVNHSNGD
jgi:hypothetical protein